MSPPKLTTLYDAYLMDLDGTVYLGDRLLPTARETILKLRQMHRRVIFLTNEASQTRQHFANKLEGLGLPTHSADIINPTTALIGYLHQHYPSGRLFVIGEPALCNELQQAGFYLYDAPDQVEVVIASNDHHFDYRKLKIAFDSIRAGATFLATNADRTIPIPGGSEEPDTAPIIAAIEACTNHPLDVMIGKPSTFMAEVALKLADAPAQRCILVGDNLETDIQMGENAGMKTALVLTGVASGGNITPSQIQPDYIIRQLADLLPISL
jgi:arabinose operon protein AraL